MPVSLSQRYMSLLFLLHTGATQAFIEPLTPFQVNRMFRLRIGAQLYDGSGDGTRPKVRGKRGARILNAP
jgi:hypothetical protein